MEQIIDLKNLSALELLMEVVEEPEHAKRQLLKIQRNNCLTFDELHSLYKINKKTVISGPEFIEDWMRLFSFFKIAGGNVADLK